MLQSLQILINFINKIFPIKNLDKIPAPEPAPGPATAPELAPK